MYTVESFRFSCERGLPPPQKIDTSDYGKVHCETNKIEGFLIKEITSCWRLMEGLSSRQQRAQIFLWVM